MRGAAAVALSATLWGTWVLILDRAAIDGLWAATLSLTAIAVGGLPLVRHRLVRDRGSLLALAAIGVADALNNALYFAALERGPVATAVLTHYLAPLIVALASPLVLRTLPRPRTWFAVVASLGGLALVLGPGGGDSTTAVLGAASAFAYATNILISKRFSGRLRPAELLVWHAVVSAALLWPVALTRPTPSTEGASIVLAAGLVIGLFGGVIFMWGLGRIPAARVGVLTYIEPLVGLLLGIFVLGEPMAPLAPLGAAVILGAGLLVVTEREAPA